MIITTFLLLVALGVLGWGFYRAKPYGQVGLLSWLQSVVLMLPWLIFFGLAGVGVYVNLAGVLLLFLVSTGSYIGLGRRLRKLSQDPEMLKQIAELRLSKQRGGQTSQLSEPDLSAKVDEPDRRESRPMSGADSNSERGSMEDSTVQSSDQADQSAVGTASELEPHPIPLDELKKIQSIFSIDTFFSTDTIPFQDGAIFKGNLRCEAAIAHERLSEKLATQVGDRYRVFLVPGSEDKPVVIVLPSANDPKPTTIGQTVLAIALFIATVLTCLETSSLLLEFDLLMDFSRFQEALPFAGGILLILVSHEIGHRAIARRYQIRISPPFFIPAWQIGSFGAITRLESLLPNRSALFDLAFAGPAVGGLVSLAMLMAGLLLSHPGSFFQVPSEFFQGSILVGSLARIILGSAIQQPIVDIHPLTLLGWLGLVITTLNLMPAGQLDGGRIVQSIYGRKVVQRTTIGTIIVLVLASFVNVLALYWAILILFLQRNLERPALEELTEPDDARAALGLLALFLMAATLLPLTPSLAGRLGIGG